MLSLYRPFSNRRTRCRCGRRRYEAGGVARARVGRIAGACARGGAECKWVGNTAGRRRVAARTPALTSQSRVLLPRCGTRPPLRTPAAGHGLQAGRPRRRLLRGSAGARVPMLTEPTSEADGLRLDVVLEGSRPSCGRTWRRSGAAGGRSGKPPEDAAAHLADARGRRRCRPIRRVRTSPQRRLSFNRRARLGHRRSTPSPRPCVRRITRARERRGRAARRRVRFDSAPRGRRRGRRRPTPPLTGNYWGKAGAAGARRRRSGTRRALATARSSTPAGGRRGRGWRTRSKTNGKCTGQP